MVDDSSEVSLGLVVEQTSNAKESLGILCERQGELIAQYIALRDNDKKQYRVEGGFIWSKEPIQIGGGYIQDLLDPDRDHNYLGRTYGVRETHLA